MGSCRRRCHLRLLCLGLRLGNITMACRQCHAIEVQASLTYVVERMNADDIALLQACRPEASDELSNQCVCLVGRDRARWVGAVYINLYGSLVKVSRPILCIANIPAYLGRMRFCYHSTTISGLLSGLGDVLSRGKAYCRPAEH